MKTIYNNRKSPRVIAKLKRTFNDLETAFNNIVRNRIQEIGKDFLKKVSPIISSEELPSVSSLKIDMRDVRSIIFNYLRECRRAGRQTGITEALGLKQRAEKKRKAIRFLEAGFDEIVDDFINDISIQLNPENKLIASNFSVVPYDALRFYDDYSLHLAGNIEQSLLSQAKDKIYSGIQNGLSHQDIMNDLSVVFTSFSENRLQNISRTEISKAMNQGRLEAFKSPVMNGFIVAVEFSAILDARTTDMCEERDGLIMALDDPRLPRNTPPLHFMCRSILIPIDKYSAEEEGLTDKIGQGWEGIMEPLKGFGGISVSSSNEKNSYIERNLSTAGGEKIIII